MKTLARGWPVLPFLLGACGPQDGQGSRTVPRDEVEVPSTPVKTANDEAAGTDSSEVTTLWTADAPYVTFQVPTPPHHTIEIKPRSILFYPTYEGAPLTRYPPSIRVSGAAKHDRTDQWAAWWRANAKKNPQGIEMARDFNPREKRAVFVVDHAGTHLEIHLADFNMKHFPGESMTAMVFETFAFFEPAGE